MLLSHKQITQRSYNRWMRYRHFQLSSEAATPRPKQRTTRSTRPARPARPASAPTVKERDISDLLAKHERGKREVHTPSGYIDVLTDKYVDEVKIASKWKAAMGQVLAYKTYYPAINPASTSMASRRCRKNSSRSNARDTASSSSGTTASMVSRRRNSCRRWANC